MTALPPTAAPSPNAPSPNAPGEARPLHIGIVVSQPEPPVAGGAERLWRALAERLTARGHRCEVVGLPTPESTLDEVLAGYQCFAELDVRRFDVVITGKYPAWIIDHPRHLVYLLHPLRGVYDTYPATLGPLAASVEGRRMISELQPLAKDPVSFLTRARELVALLADDDPDREIQRPLGQWLIQQLDQVAFARATSFAAISEEVASRPGYLPADQPVMISHPETDLPLVDADLDPVTTFFTASRLDRPKRIDLIIRGFRRLHDSAAQLLIAGEGPERAALGVEAAGDRRIVFLGRLDEVELARLYATATAVVFTPDREDFGYIALEAMRAGTPVITTEDSGGPCELVEHGVNGLVVEPSDDEIRWAMEHLSAHPHLRWQYSLAARRRAAMVSWDPLLDVVEELADPVVRPRALVVSTYGVDPMIGGGQRRSRYLNRALSRSLDVTLLVLSSTSDITRRRRLETGFVQIEVPRSDAQLDAETEIYEFIDLPVDDLTIAELAPATPEFGVEVQRQLDRSDIVISTHPFLVPALPELTIPLVYDSQNAEAEMKAQLLPETDAGRWLLERAVRSETEAVTRSALITTCTAGDLETVRALAPALNRPGTVVENGVDTAAMPQRQSGDRQLARLEALSLANADIDDTRPLALFIGSWHPPNLDAARLILELAALRPDWLFILAGSHSSEFAAGPLPANVHTISIFPEPSLWPLLAGADVGLNPMVSGGGSNLKVFDYLSVGVPVLSTPVGARGLHDPESVMLVVAADAPSLATGLDALHPDAGHPDGLRLETQSIPGDGNDENKVAQRVRAGRALVEASYDWEVLGRRWSHAILSTSGLQVDSIRPSRSIELLPVLSTEPPPSANPSIAIMRLVGNRARTTPPPVQEITMDPALRESIKRAADNRRMGQQLPPGARFRIPKEAVIRAGRALSNEQVNFNQAAIESLENLGAQVFDLRASHDRLDARLLAAEEQNLELRQELASLQSWRGSFTPPSDRAHVATDTPSQNAPTHVTPADLSVPAGPALVATSELDRFYQAFEDRFRGSRDEVKALLADHLAAVQAAGGPVLDVGTGRGEWLEILRDEGVEATGVDTNTVAVERSTALGLDVTAGDAILHLQSLPAGSLGVVTGFHLLEHLRFDARLALTEAAFRALRPGGLLLVETPNALNLQVAATSIWLDPTHLHPIHPAQLEFLFAHVGFTEVRIQPLHPLPEDATIPRLADADDREAFLSEMAKLVYGSHDVAVSGRKPGG